MIEYKIIEGYLSKRLSLLGYDFDQTTGSLLIMIGILDKGAKIQSGEFFIAEEAVRFVLSYEFPDTVSSEAAQGIAQKVNDIFKSHCFDVRCVHSKKHQRNFLSLCLTALMPQPKFVEGEIFNTYSALSVLWCFLDDYKGYSPLWQDGAEVIAYVSMGISLDKGWGGLLHSARSDQVYPHIGMKMAPVDPDEIPD